MCLSLNIAFKTNPPVDCKYQRLGKIRRRNRFGSVVRAYAQSGDEVGIRENLAGRTFPFSLLFQNGISFEFGVVLVNPSEI